MNIQGPWGNVTRKLAEAYDSRDFRCKSLSHFLCVCENCISFTIAMSTQQDIYAAGSESRSPMLNKENYVPWSSRLLR
nr:ribonuclease H-like domain-containing protein [Tanacetum cinerariifolium]